MEIIFVINDYERCELVYRHTGHYPAIKRRYVKFHLTDAQIRMLGLQKVGREGGIDLMESIESISLTPPKSEE